MARTTLENTPDGLNAEPVVVRGFTAAEMFWTTGLGALLGLLVGVVPGLLLSWVYVPISGLLNIIVSFIIGGRILAHLKRGRPDNFLYRRLEVRLTRWGGGNPRLVLWGRFWASQRPAPVTQE